MPTSLPSVKFNDSLTLMYDWVGGLIERERNSPLENNQVLLKVPFYYIINVSSLRPDPPLLSTKKTNCWSPQWIFHPMSIHWCWLWFSYIVTECLMTMKPAWLVFLFRVQGFSHLRVASGWVWTIIETLCIDTNAHVHIYTSLLIPPLENQHT